jgi:uncharacterized damage-inducible protein DinB
MAPGLIDHYRFMGRYNRWLNERLYAACEPLGDEARQRERGAFFGSIHQTLAHVVWGDTLWLQRFAGQGAGLDAAQLVLPAGAGFGVALHPVWQDLKRERERLDTLIESWLAQMDADFLARTMHYTTTKGVQREHPMWQALSHFFNHQTHHRGQVSTLLMQAGVDVGVTDLIALAA